MNTFERDTIAEIRARVTRGLAVADWEKQLVLNILRREGTPVPAEVIRRATASGFDTVGLKIQSI